MMTPYTERNGIMFKDKLTDLKDRTQDLVDEVGVTGLMTGVAMTLAVIVLPTIVSVNTIRLQNAEIASKRAYARLHNPTKK